MRARAGGPVISGRPRPGNAPARPLTGELDVNSPLRILVATDAAQHAVAWAAEFAQATGAEVILVHAMSTSGEWLMSVAQIDFVHIEAERRECLDGVWSEALRTAGVTYRTKFMAGDPVALLLGTADEHDVDA